MREAYIGPEGVLTGSARLAQEAKDRAAQLTRQQEIERRSREVERKRHEITGQIADLQAQLANEEHLREQVVEFEDRFAADRIAMGLSRQAQDRQFRRHISSEGAEGAIGKKMTDQDGYNLRLYAAGRPQIRSLPSQT